MARERPQTLPDDFDEGGASDKGKWDSVKSPGGPWTIGRVTTQSRSAPRSLEVVHAAIGAADPIEALLFKYIGGRSTGMTCTFAFFAETLPTPEDQAFAVFGHPDPTAPMGIDDTEAFWSSISTT